MFKSSFKLPSGRRATAGAISLAALLLLPLPLSAQQEQTAEQDLALFAGDYSIAVYPEPFGFLAREGTLYLKVGGVDGEGRETPLIAQPNGRFVLAPDHPNAFQFELVDGEVRFTLWAMGHAIPGQRAGEAEAAPEAERPASPRDEKTRAELFAELARAERDIETDPTNPELHFTFGELLYQSGDFWRAEELLRPLHVLFDTEIALAARVPSR